MADRDDTSRRRTSGSARGCRLLLLVVPMVAGVMWAADGVSDNRPTAGHRGGCVAPPPLVDSLTDGDSGFDAARRSYLGILQQAARLDTASVDAMAELQRRVYDEDALRGLAKLHRYQLSTASAMAARNPAIFRPIVWLHYETAGSYLRREDQPLRAPSYLLAADLAASMMRSARSDAMKHFATDVMLCTAYTFLGEGSKGHADGIFGRVAQLVPGNGPALLGSAAIRERRGSYQEAVDTLSPLVASSPGNCEARLRLAVNLARVDQRAAAEDQLRTLVSSCDREWVNVVGFQELARRLMMRGRPAEAEGVLRQALESFPADHTLAVQLAVVLDAQGRPGEAARVVEALKPEATGGGSSPRWRYSVWPDFDLTARENQLRQLAEDSAPDLAEVLAAHTELGS